MTPEPLDIRAFNRTAWDRQVETGNPWTIPVTSEQIQAARRGEWTVVLTASKAVPRSWFPPDLHGVDLLGLASGGGQQMPILAAAGARVTLLDNSPRQLERDRVLAEREGLSIRLLEGDMRDLSALADASFDLVFHPVSNLFIPDPTPVWREAFRVLRPGGCLLAGFCNPDTYLFDPLVQDNENRLEVRFKLPYSDLEALGVEEHIRRLGPEAPLEWSHSMDSLVGAQLDAGFVLAGFYEDRDPEGILSAYMPHYYATRAVKPPFQRN